MKMIKKTGIIVGVCSLVLLFSFQSRFFEIAKQIEIYNNLFKELNINYIDEINPGELTSKAINNTLENLDPYTRFYNEQQVEDARIKREGEYAGIGISSYYTKKGIIVAGVHKGFPADKAGIKPGDLITVVNNQELKDLEKEQLSETLKGTPDTPISLTINRNGSLKNLSLKLDKVTISPVPFYDMIDDETGYIVLTSFTVASSSEDVKKAFNELKEKGMKKLVFDLRNNLGGSLFDAINIVNFFIPKGKKIVETKGKIKKNSRVYKGRIDPIDTEIPIVVLINGRSASASEIVSGALQDYDRAVVMGERSFGKGLVQRVFPLNYGTQMKVTISKYYTPSGRCIQELDYANRDAKTGKVPKFSDGTVNSFKTENGRTVYDGGGVTPDVAIKYSTKTKETEKLLKSRAIFGYGNHFIRKNPSISLNTFTYNASNFNDFKNYLLKQDTTFVTKQEALFKKAYKVNKQKEIDVEYTALLQKLKENKVKKIATNEDILIEKIQNEIVEQLFYKEGVYKHQFLNDNTIKKAVSLLKDTKKYNQILSK
ncbi:peptidase S41 [Tenacibaculum holothuriorum]|uniref:Peptidase S41 n=1 Tax=Tenacibaculum holothuriorum TaxID=1635173 RepID=A0A1Y2PAH6_9FLAO|nr:S41 family peptidase [Tenacibaculum holothuriorum]OSY87031.1 peptidase S41 [Tenacibaculum holothuriorum]